MKPVLRYSLAAMFAVLCACSPKMTEPGKRQPPLIPPDAAGVVRCEMGLSARGKVTSCLLLVKRTGPESIRIAGSTWFGMSLFDVSFSDGVFAVNSCVEFMNRKRIIRLLEKDFRTVFISGGGKGYICEDGIIRMSHCGLVKINVSFRRL